MKRAIFLDRDGTIIEDRNFICRTDDIRFLPHAVAALRQLQRAGFPLFIITNQSGVARGLFSMDDVERLNSFLREQLVKQSIVIENVFVCPHLPEDGCDCRKPSPKFVRQAAIAHKLDLTQSYFIGDRLSDIETGRNAGCTPILLRTGLGEKTLAEHADQLCGVVVAKDLAAAARLILKSQPRKLAA